ncbi:LytTR family transcriptional regulator DNA-binding domain-containing protein [Ferdinandcohnia quinoae]|uniref:LytTR family transcriptional regulator DNA-binding domain-containing protein n=1 Tax=Fredinandcohnia quinoae TaxID=2918902 RepID=A0AAW5E5G8_9BACI|nr:LytTR family transcriptional regulator DNA-binding domain-containing protein [Fredinandcohnia sp. SECRCQ15]MCH1625302.1 LytTR family transcriptional regulator DNA-binding domain-containing protein [Fredinandcohnia sp. SECRCQ15]
MSVLCIKQLEKRKGNSLLFLPFDLELHNGEVVAIQCNVEVSTELIHILIGKSAQSGGEIYFLGEKRKSYKELSKRVGLVLIDDALYERLTPLEYLTFFKRLYEVKIDVNEVLRQIGLTENKRIAKLSFSEKKRLQIGRAIVHDPDLVIVEEPIQNVDIESIFIIQNIIKDLTNNGKTVLITTSNLENAILMSNSVYRLREDGLKEIDVLSEDDKQVDNEEITESEKEDVIKKTPNEPKPFRFEKIPAKVNDKIILLDPTEIDYIESNDGVSNLHVKGEIFPCTYTMNELFDRLSPFGFFRCHRSYIVNLQKVKEVITWTRNSYSLILEDSKKSSVPLSKGNLNELKEIIGI